MDGWRNSFVLLQYDAVEWTTGDKSGGSNGFNNALFNSGTAACVGVNKGDGTTGYMHPSSLSPQVLGVATDASSTGVAGRILLQVGVRIWRRSCAPSAQSDQDLGSANCMLQHAASWRRCVTRMACLNLAVRPAGEQRHCSQPAAQTTVTHATQPAAKATTVTATCAPTLTTACAPPTTTTWATTVTAAKVWWRAPTIWLSMNVMFAEPLAKWPEGRD